MHKMKIILSTVGIKAIRQTMATIATIVLFCLVGSLPASAQIPDLVGLDHVGFNVPVLDQAVQFFTDVRCLISASQQRSPVSLCWRRAMAATSGFSNTEV